MSAFTAIVDSWVTDVPERIEFVFRESFQRTLSYAQEPVGAGGNMPIKDGFLRASLVVSLGTDVPLQTSKPKEGVPYAWNATGMTLAIAGATHRSVITAAWTANYARVAEYGGPNRLARRFRDLAAQRWPQTVATVAIEAKARGEASRG